MPAMNAQRRQINQAAQALVGQVAQAAVARYGAGTGGHHDVARTQVEQASLEVQAVELRGERTSVVAMMNALRNAAPDSPIDEPGAFDDSPAPDGTLAQRERCPDLMTSGDVGRQLRKETP